MEETEGRETGSRIFHGGYLGYVGDISVQDNVNWH